MGGWGEASWDTLKEIMPGDLDTLSWETPFGYPKGYIQERRIDISWQWTEIQGECIDGFYHHGTRS